MKKSVISVLISLIILLTGSVISQAIEINLCAPVESEIMPTRDFYVVGEIDRQGKTPREEPVNIKIELINKNGDVVRSLVSNVPPSGLTDASYFMTDYESGSAYNDQKGAYINSLTPPDIMYDGMDRDSIRLSYNKIVVKENYFAAVIYGGATKNIDLRFSDMYENPLSDITSGQYELVITALNADGEEICRNQSYVNIGNNKERIIAQNVSNNFLRENSLVLPNSIVGYWNPQNYFLNTNNNFVYVSQLRLLDNIRTEFGSSKKVNVLLNNLDTNSTIVNMMLGCVFSEESTADVSYWYYDIGEEIINFNLAGSTLKREAEIIKSDNNNFIEVLRAESTGDVEGQTYMDFNMDDGVLISEKSGTTFYGVYSPVITSSTLSTSSYLINDKVSRVKAVIVDENNNIIFEQINTAALIKENSESTSRFEFKFEIYPNKEMLKSNELTLKISALDTNGEVLLSSKDICTKISRRGYFIAGYEDNYWGKIFCDTVNDLGRSPSGEAMFPDVEITRGDFAAMVNHLLGYALTGESTFSDLDADSIYYSDCITAQQVGYMTGDEKGNINADALISREQAMIILARICGATKGEEEIIFKDSGQISFWAKDYVDAMCSTGIVSGFDGYINPTDNITVAEAAALIIKTIKWMNTDDDVLPVGVGNNFTATENIKEADFDSIKITDIDIVERLEDKDAVDYFVKNINAFVAIANYLEENYTEGISIKKVGNGLDIRDYKTGNIVKISDDAVDLTTKLCYSLVSFSIKYNPVKSETMYFKLGINKEGKEIGVAYTASPEAKGKIFEELTENWYFYRQE